MAERMLDTAADRRVALTLLADLRSSSGRVAAAIPLWRELAEITPRDSANLRRLGHALIAAGRPAEAVEILERAVVIEPDNIRGLNNLGQALMQLRRYGEAVKLFERAVAVEPAYVIGLTNLALAAERLELAAKALEAYERLIVLQPANADAHVKRGRLLWGMQRAGDALQSLEAALVLQPQDATALALKAAALLALGQPSAALAASDEALSREPGSAEALQYRAAALCQLKRHAEALPDLERALELAPDDLDAWCNCAVLHSQLGDSEAAQRCYRQALILDPGHLGARCGLLAALIPAVPRSIAAALEARADFDREIAAFETWIDARELTEGEAWTLAGQHFFYLSYQEISNVELLRRYRRASAARLARYAPQVRAAGRTRRGRFRLGIVSAQVFDHSIFNAMTRGWLENLDRERFEVTLFSLGGRRDASTDRAERLVDRFEAQPLSVRDWARLIHDHAPDALLYPEVGIDRHTLALASLRLAPRQLAAWGHPETSGLPTIDDFVSAADLEPADADAHYTERLLRLPHLGVHYEPYALEPERVDRAALGVPDDGPLLICPGTPFKYDPSDDTVLVEIARQLGACTFVFFTYERPALSERLRDRITAAFAAAGLDPERFLKWIPWQPRAAFLGLLARADVYLDTLRFSGFNTLMQAVQVCLPCVSHDGRYLRGRLGSGILRRLALHELIAMDHSTYIEIAVRLASDHGYRRDIAARMQRAAPRAYADRSAVEALEHALLA